MKILCLNHYENDFLADSLLRGLYLVAQSRGYVIDELPIIKHIHGEVDTVYIPAYGKIGQCCPPGMLIRNPPPYPLYTEDDILNESIEYDLIVMTSMRHFSRKALSDFCKKKGKQPKDLPLVVCDGEDTEWVDVPYLEEVQPKVFFKRELYKNNFYQKIGKDIPVWPLQFSAHIASLPPDIEYHELNKRLDLYLNMGLTHERRIALTQAFIEATCTYSFRSWINLEPQHPSIQWDNAGRDTWDGYMRNLAASKISATVRGYGGDTLHYWENFSVNTLTFVDDPGLVIPYPFTEHKHYIPIEYPYSNVARMLQAWLALWKNYPNEIVRIAEAARAHCRKYHSTEKRAKYLIDVALGYLSGSIPKYEDCGI